MALPSLVSKLPETSASIFTVMSVMAAQNKAINLGQGLPDYPMNPELIALVSDAMKAGANQYAHSDGVMALREVIAEKIEFLYKTKVDPVSQITVTPGGTYAIYNALTAVLRPGDEVIVFEPAYDSYVPNILVNGAVPVIIELELPDYAIDWQKVREKVSSKTRMIVLNTPHNPTAAILREEDIQELRSIVADTEIFILSDEVYEHLIYDGRAHLSMLRYPDLLERSFVCFSFGKVYHCTGWKLGYCVSSPEFMNEFRRVHQYNCFSCHTPSQVGLSEFLRIKESYLGLSSFMQSKRDLFRNLMEESRFEPLPSYGSYFQLYKYDAISDESDIAFAKRITLEYGVASIPLSAFYHSGKDDHVLRFCFAKKDETLERAVQKLKTI